MYEYQYYKKIGLFLPCHRLIGDSASPPATILNPVIMPPAPNNIGVSEVRAENVTISRRVSLLFDLEYSNTDCVNMYLDSLPFYLSTRSDFKYCRQMVLLESILASIFMTTVPELITISLSMISLP
jgi:hypothetical protein